MEIIAHRGASHDAPENTLAAVRLAWSQDADAVEVDVHTSADDQLVVIHDSDTGRTGDRDLTVATTAWEDLRTVDVGRWRGPAHAGERIPLLDAVLATVPSGRKLFVELKVGGPAIGELVRALARSRLNPAQVVVIAFAFDCVCRVHQLLPRCETYWLLEATQPDGAPTDIAAAIARAKAAGLKGLNVAAERIDQDCSQRVREAGMTLYAWTVDEPEDALRLAALGVQGVTTNRPGWLRTQLMSLA